MSTEKTLQGAIVRAVKRTYPDAWVFHPVGGPIQTIGIPDLLVVVEGHLYAFEIKHQKPGESAEHAYGRTTPQQRLQIDLLRRAGATATTVLSVEEVLAELASH